MEGETIRLELHRSRGSLGDILIGWEIDDPGVDWLNRSGFVSMKDGGIKATFVIVPKNDKV